MRTDGKIVYLPEAKQGVSAKTGEIWQSQTFVVETKERYPRKVAFELFGKEKIETAALKLGESVEVIALPYSHEFKGTWYTEMRVTDIVQNGFSRLVKRLF